MNVPFFKNFRPDLLISPLAAAIPGPIRWRSSSSSAFCGLVLVGSSNAVNLTDGLDGLAIGLMVIASGAMTVLTYVERPRAIRAVPGPGAPARRRAS